MSDNEQVSLNPENTNPGWKDRDINMRLVVWITTVVFTVFFGTMVAMFFLVKALNKREAYNKKSDQMTAERMLPEGDVLLQVDAVQDLNIYLANEERILTSYAEVAAGHVRTPIEVAKRHMLAKGFSARDVDVPALFAKPAVMPLSEGADAHVSPSIESHSDHGHDAHGHEGHAH